MHYYLTARHFPLTDSIREHVETHLAEPVQTHTDARSLTRMEVQLELGQRDAPYRCHVLVQLRGHHDINVTEEGEDLYAAIDLAKKRLLRCLVDDRQKQQTLSRHPRKFSAERIERALRTAR